MANTPGGTATTVGTAKLPNSGKGGNQVNTTGKIRQL